MTFGRLELTCKHNRLGNVICLCRAAMDKSGKVFIDDGQADISNAVAAAAGAGSQLCVQGETLDEICRRQGIEHIDFLKMNIEGADAGPSPA